MEKNNPKLVVKDPKELVEHLFRHIDKEKIKRLNFAEFEDFLVDFTKELGQDLLQEFVNLKSESKRPKNIVIPATDKNKKKH